MLINLLIIFTECNRREIEETTIEKTPCKTDNCITANVKGKFFLIKQIYPNSCWAAVLSMMYSWKNQEYISETKVLKPFPLYAGIYSRSDKEGIKLNDELVLYQQLGLVIEKQLNPTINGWAEMINEHGPLSVTIDARPPYGTLHAIVVLGIYGKDTGLDTKIIYADPGDGKIYEQDFLVFLKMYEAKYSVDWLIQIIHFTKEYEKF